MKYKNPVNLTFVLIFITLNYCYSFNFLINMFYNILPSPIKSAFKAENLKIDQFEYGIGNCNFTSLGYLNSSINYKLGQNIDEEFEFNKPNIYIYAGYIAHVSTPILNFIYPGWQLETELYWGGVSYNSKLKKDYKEFFFTGSSGLNFTLYKSKNYYKSSSTIINLGIGYKLHYILKDLIYYNLQIGFKASSKISLLYEYFSVIKGGNFFLFTIRDYEINSKETSMIFSLNFVLSDKYLLRISHIIKNWMIKGYSEPNLLQRNSFYGIVLFLISR